MEIDLARIDAAAGQLVGDDSISAAVAREDELAEGRVGPEDAFALQDGDDFTNEVLETVGVVVLAPAPVVRHVRT